MQLSRLENLAVETIKQQGFLTFKVKDLCLQLKIDRIAAYNLIKTLKKKGIIKKIKQSYILKEINELSLGAELYSPAYLSFWSALNYYGYSDQLPKEIYFATPRHTKRIEPFRYISLNPARFFGYVSLGGLVIAEKEKVFLDSLLLPRYAGGIKEIKRCLGAAISELNLKKLIAYAEKMKSKSVLRRLGFLLEGEEIEERLLAKLRKKIGKGFEKLDPVLPNKGRFNKKWLLDINC